jgi:adenylate kinase
VIRLLIIGPPGAGKGTQAARVAEHYSIPAISTGDIFRANVSQGTELGLKAKAYMDAGDYVPDSLTNDLVRDRLGQPDASVGFLLDGYPRTADQTAELDSILRDSGHALDGVIQLTADTEELVKRLLKRAAEQGRSDDNADTIRRRLEVYEDQTAHLIDIYAARGLVSKINGLGSMDEVFGRIIEALEASGFSLDG